MNVIQNISYYYAKQKELDGVKTLFQNVVFGKVTKYNRIMSNAPVKLFTLYIALYVHNGTQAVVAHSWNCSRDYIKQLNKQLCAYLYNEMKKEGNK